MKTESELKLKVKDFLKAFEEVFEHDWYYTSLMIGDEKEGCTFLNPGLEDETEDWGNRGILLQKYRQLISFLEK